MKKTILALIITAIAPTITAEENAIKETQLAVDVIKVPIVMHQWSLKSGGNGHSYAVLPIATDWESAGVEASRRGGHLATITSAQEQEFINGAVLVGQFERVPMWIGLFRDKQTRNFKWVKKEPFTFALWKKGEPNNHKEKEEDYVALNWDYARSQGEKGSWNDCPLYGTIGYKGNTDGPYYSLIEFSSPKSPFVLIGAISLFICVIVVAYIVFKRNRRTDQST